MFARQVDEVNIDGADALPRACMAFITSAYASVSDLTGVAGMFLPPMLKYHSPVSPKRFARPVIDLADEVCLFVSALTDVNKDLRTE